MDNKTKDGNSNGRQFCQKPRHNKEEFIFFNWDDDKQNILLCPNCQILDNNPNKSKLYIKQILNLQENQSIINWPLRSSEQTQEIIKKWQQKSNQKEYFQKLQQQMINEVEKYFETKLSEIKTAILTKKKNCIQKLNDIFEKEMQFLNENNLQEIFDLQEIKKSLQSYYSNQSEIDELFQIQQDKKKQFIQENKIQEINVKLEKMMANLENDKQKLIQENQINIEKLFLPKIQQILTFRKSNYNYSQDLIKISQDQNQITFQGKISSEQQIYTNVLNKDKTYKIKIKFVEHNILLQGNDIHIYLGIGDFKKRDKDLIYINYTKISTGIRSRFNCFKKEKTLQQLLQHGQDEIYVEFNFNYQIFKIYDEKQEFFVEEQNLQTQEIDKPIFYIKISNFYQNENIVMKISDEQQF